jgi:hypothetical protein
LQLQRLEGTGHFRSVPPSRKRLPIRSKWHISTLISKASVERLDAIFQLARSDPQADIGAALRGVQRGERQIPGPVHLCGAMSPVPAPPTPSPAGTGVSLALRSRRSLRAGAVGGSSVESREDGSCRDGRASKVPTARRRSRPVADISREDVRAFRDHRGENLLAFTLNIKVMSRLVSFFKIACSKNAIQSPIISPCFPEQISQLLHQSHVGSLQVQNGSRSP